jgi:hypothetical protein
MFALRHVQFFQSAHEFGFFSIIVIISSHWVFPFSLCLLLFLLLFLLSSRHLEILIYALLRRPWFNIRSSSDHSFTTVPSSHRPTRYVICMMCGSFVFFLSTFFFSLFFFALFDIISLLYLILFLDAFVSVCIAIIRYYHVSWCRVLHRTCFV